MSFSELIDLFIHPERFKDPVERRKARILVKACWLTSLFSTSYIFLSVLFEYEKGIWLMIYNAVGFICLSFFVKTKWPISLLGNFYVFIGASAVIALAYFSGGILSALYPWIISIPVLALLIVGRSSSLIWGAISLGFMIWMGILANSGFAFPVEYNQEYQALWFLSIVPGLLLIVLFMSLVFEHNQTRALEYVEQNNQVLSEQKMTIEAQSKRLEKLLDEKGYIIRVLAHDLRNPLNNISSLVNLMSIEDEKERNQQYNKMILSASENAKNLVNKVLEMEVANDDNLKLEFERIELEAALTQVLCTLDQLVSSKKILLQTDFHTEAVFISIDTTYFNLIIENLISNAVKFSNHGSTVVLRTSCEDSKVQIRVIDQGPGVLKEEQEKLFQKFTKLSARPTAGEASSGLGLSLVKRYAELLNGRVYYEDAPAGGAVFVVELPIQESK